ncbi:MAG: hypothetical protein V5804_01975 [Mucilaginibacter sp.]|uniref:hypothetical protein n=1 Tax=Mucilaginibacter sp. TaxID=1882438 RepID=UPI0034E47C25
MTNSFSAYSQKTDVLEIRKAMLRAIKSPIVTDSLYNELQKINKKPPLILGYFGSLQALKAKDSWNPYKKVKMLTSSHKTMEQAVNASPNDLEIRFLRFSIEFYLPGFLGLSKDMVSDKNMIIHQLKLKNYGLADKDYLKNIIKFMVDSKQCTAQEVAFLHEQLAAIK